MEQYYMPVIKEVKTNKKYMVNMKYIDGDNVNLKLTEHSWWENSFCNAIDTLLYKTQYRVAWLGDYADEKDNPHYNEIIAQDNVEEMKLSDCVDKETELFNLYLCNHSKKLYINCNDYYERSEDDNGWHTHPTAAINLCW
jgi:hypothetical protein